MVAEIEEKVATDISETLDCARLDIRVVFRTPSDWLVIVMIQDIETNFGPGKRQRYWPAAALAAIHTATDIRKRVDC